MIKVGDELKGFIEKQDQKYDVTVKVFSVLLLIDGYPWNAGTYTLAGYDYVFYFNNEGVMYPESGIEGKLEIPVDWTKVVVDAKVLVRDFDSQPWKKRHFSHYDQEDHVVYTFIDGYTSWTEDGTPAIAWSLAKLAI